jgi:hypothetical protein
VTLAEDLNLPDSIVDELQFQPAVQLFKVILEPLVDPIKVISSISEHPPLPFILIRRRDDVGNWHGDPRGLIDVAHMVVHVYSNGHNGVNGEAACYVLSDFIRKKLYEASQAQYYDGDLGALSRLRVLNSPSRETDWATSSGPVQYADLPAGTWRYETHYEARIRPPGVYQ